MAGSIIQGLFALAMACAYTFGDFHRILHALDSRRQPTTRNILYAFNTSDVVWVHLTSFVGKCHKKPSKACTHNVWRVCIILATSMLEIGGTIIQVLCAWGK